MTVGPDLVAVVSANLGALLAFARMLDQRLKRIETIHEVAQQSGRCPFHASAGPCEGHHAPRLH